MAPSRTLAPPAVPNPPSRAGAPAALASSAALPFFFQAAPPPPVQTLTANCASAQTTYTLGDGICVTVSVPASLQHVPHRVQLVTPAGFVYASLDVAENPQTVTFTLPSATSFNVGSRTFDNRGPWRVNLTDAIDANVLAAAPITVRDPQLTVANVQINKLIANSLLATAGTNIQTLIRVYNTGPDAAANVKFTDVPPANTSFVSLSQTAGPAFNCTNTAGSTVCTAASLARDTAADFVITYLVNSNIANATELTTTASVETTTTETDSGDNGASESLTSDNPTPPACTMTCPANITVTAAEGQNGATVAFADPTLSGTCGTVTNTPASGTFFPVGTTQVTSTADGGSCSFFVTVNPAADTVAPSISCPSDITVSESSSSANSATVAYTVTADDDSGAVTVNCDPPSGSSFPAGTTEVQCTATDASNNSSSCSFNVTVTQTGCDLDANSDPPVPNVALLPTVTRACSVTLLASDDPTATDDCGGTVSGEITAVNGQPSTDRVYDVPGTYVVTWTYTDSAGHSATQNQTFVISPDNTAPVPDAASLPTVTGECTASITGAAPTANDNCGGSGIEGTPLDPLSYNTPGTHTVRWKFTDPAGNSTIQNQTVVVTDGAPPVPDVASLPTLTGECSVTVTPPTATDSCAGAIIAVTPDPLTYTAQGTHIVHWTYTDAAGNATTQNQTVIVDDNTAPTINITGGGSTTVECGTGYTDAGATATDNCNGSVQVTTTGNNVNAGVPGTYHVNYSAQDAVGNTTTATRTVTVVDTTKPVITLNGANPMSVILGSAFVDPGATAADGCAGTFAATPSGSVNTGAIGTYTVNYNATDPSGNAAVPVARTVNVIYDFTGFFSPVNNAALNQVNAGRSVPVKFSLAGNHGLGIMAAGSPYSQQVTCGSNTPTDLQETGTAGSSSLSYDASSNQYHYVWKTESSWAGTCRLLTVALIDGTTHAATFKFK